MKTLKKHSFSPSVLALSLMLLGFSQQVLAEEAKAPATEQTVKQVPVTATLPLLQPLVISEGSVGKIQSLTSPKVAAQVSGEVVSILVDVGDQVKEGMTLARLDDTDYQLEKQAALAEIQRIEALIPAQKLQVQRFQNLVSKNSSSQSKLDEAEAQLGSLKAQMVGAKVRLSQAERKISLCKIVSPINGRVNARQISKGDFLSPGTKAFELVDNQNLQAILPFPERLKAQIQPGLVVLLTSDMNPEQTLKAKISDIRPMIQADSLSVEAIAKFENSLNWSANGSVSGKLILSETPEALWIPEQSLVARPNGKVVYVIENGQAKQQRVTTGEHQNGQIQILSGLTKDQQIVVSGAGFLTDGAAIKVVQ